MHPGISKDIKQLVKDSVDAETLLSSLGFKLVATASNELRGPCLLHGGDNPTAFSFRTDTNRWRCYTKKCEQSRDGSTDNDLIAIIQKTNNLNFVDSLQYLADFACLGIDVKDSESTGKEDFSSRKDITKFVRRSNKVAVSPEVGVSEEVLQGYKRDRDFYFVEQGFKEETLEKFEIGAMIDNKGVKRATIPIRDENGKLLGTSARRESGNEEPRYKISFGLKKDKVLYNIRGAIESGSDTVILVEGFKAAWAVYEAGYKNVVACMGAAVTRGQLMLLTRSGFMKCAIMFDGDSAGDSGMETALPHLNKMFTTVTPVYLPEGISPDDMSRDELSSLLFISGINN
jgi:DNA primase